MALPLRYSLLSLLARPTSTLSSVALVALIIAAFAYLQAVTDSALNTMVASGDTNTIIIVGQAAQTETVSGLSKEQLNKLDLTPGVVAGETGALTSPEVVAISSAFTHEDSTVAVNTAVRGVDLNLADQVRHGNVKIIEGRPFNPGTYEVIVGQAAHKLYRGFDLGDKIQMGTRGMRYFEIVGIFTTGGTAADSETWGYVETLRDVYGRNGYSSARMLVNDEQAARQAINFIQGPSVELTAKTEREYFSDLNTNQNATQMLSIFMIVIMGLAAAFAVANTMYAAVAGRTREIGMLRAVGFARGSILTSFVLEGILLTVLGGALGSVISLLFNGWQRNMLPTTFTTVSYTLAVTPKIVITSMVIAVAIGLCGSIMPAWRASKLNAVTALREQ